MPRKRLHQPGLVDVTTMTDQEFEQFEAENLGISVESLKKIREPQHKYRVQKRLPGNKYVKFRPETENSTF